MAVRTDMVECTTWHPLRISVRWVPIYKRNWIIVKKKFPICVDSITGITNKAVGRYVSSETSCRFNLELHRNYFLNNFLSLWLPANVKFKTNSLTKLGLGYWKVSFRGVCPKLSAYYWNVIIHMSIMFIVGGCF